MNYGRITKLALAICVLSPVSAFAQAGFDCKKASTPTEKAICSHDDIAEADRAMSIAYTALIDRAGPDMKAALRADQESFLMQRSQAFESHISNAAMRLEGLSDRTEMRAELMNWIAVTEGPSLEGNWKNAWGSIKVEKNPSGQLAVSFDVVDQINGTWVCSFEGTLQQKTAGEAEFKGEGGPLVLRKKGAMLEIPTPFCDETTSGGFGTAAGTYFRVGAPE